MCLTENVTRRAFTDGSCVIAYTTLPSATIDVTCSSALDIGISSSNEIVVEVIFYYIVLVIDRADCTCGIDIFGHRAAKQTDIGGTVYVASIRCIRIPQTTAIGVCSAKATSIHIATDVSTLVDADVGVIFIGSQGVSQTIVGIDIAQREVNRCCVFCIPSIDGLLVHYAAQLSTAIHLV